MKIYQDSDANLGLQTGRQIAVIGYSKKAASYESIHE
jgi:ketol-acid reductoisomerase